MTNNKFLSDARFVDLKPFESKVWLSSPTMHGQEQQWVDEAIRTNWVSTVGENINAAEKGAAQPSVEEKAEPAARQETPATAFPMPVSWAASTVSYTLRISSVGSPMATVRVISEQ